MKAKYLIGFISLFFLLPACNKDLTVAPQNSITADQIKSSGDVEALLFGAYSGLQKPGDFGESFLFAPDLIAGDSMMDFVGTFQDYSALQNKITVSTNGIASNVWGTAYTTIDLANTVLDKIALVDTTDKATVSGEAFFIRGTCYFYLVGLYGKPYSDGNATTNLGVPLVLLPTYSYDSSANSPNKPARSTVAQTYTQIISDLQAAIAVLPTSNTDFRADVYSARAILSRVYLTMGRYADAAVQADSVIQSGNFSLTGTFDKAFNNDENSTEDIFGIQQTVQSNAGTTNNGLPTFYSSYPVGRGDAQIDPLYPTIFDDPNDFRAVFFTAGNSISGIDGNYTNKWEKIYKTIPVIRLAEMYLTRGEGNLMAGTAVGDQPVNDINVVRARALAGPLSNPAQSDFIEERFRELGFEGDRYWSLKRTQGSITGFDFDNNKLILPIPQSEIDVNKQLVQNGGY
jgi:starch-binding outer membrane protein, SusD/RagB family